MHNVTRNTWNVLPHYPEPKFAQILATVGKQTEKRFSRLEIKGQGHDQTN